MTTRRDGFTLIELLMVMVIGLMLLGAAIETLTRQERAYSQLSAIANTQQDVRIGADLMAAEFRELSPLSGDILMATPDSIRFRTIRKFGLICDTDKNNKRIVVAQTGREPFAGGDSISIYVDQDSLKARDDIWQYDAVQSTSTTTSCNTTLGTSLAKLMPEAKLVQLTLQGAGLRYDSIYPGGPIRSFEPVSYRVQNVNSSPTLVVVRADSVVSPLVGPLASTSPLVLRYFDWQGNEFTSFPLNATDRQNVRRIRLELKAAREAGGATGTYEETLMAEVYTRGS
jgi:prepilin-type N-terminal cleavage/methylation domain-containing protein